ncbi:MAG: hypothetical protein O2955_00400 [Planctomycetota bacterium]|nr:hypothetical protein [Planctomycetota bacterium]
MIRHSDFDIRISTFDIPVKGTLIRPAATFSQGEKEISKGANTIGLRATFFKPFYVGVIVENASMFMNMQNRVESAHFWRKTCAKGAREARETKFRSHLCPFLQSETTMNESATARGKGLNIPGFSGLGATASGMVQGGMNLDSEKSKGRAMNDSCRVKNSTICVTVSVFALTLHPATAPPCSSGGRWF